MTTYHKDIMRMSNPYIISVKIKKDLKGNRPYKYYSHLNPNLSLFEFDHWLIKTYLNKDSVKVIWSFAKVKRNWLGRWLPINNLDEIHKGKWSDWKTDTIYNKKEYTIFKSKTKYSKKHKVNLVRKVTEVYNRCDELVKLKIEKTDLKSIITSELKCTRVKTFTRNCED